MQITYREGRKEDAPRLGEFIDMASGGVVDYLFHDLVPGLTPVQVMAGVLAEDRPFRSYRSAIVAEHDGRLVGAALSYPGRFCGMTEEMRQFFPPDRLDFLRHFFAAPVEDSWLLDGLAVDEGFRRQGLGSELIARTKTRAVHNGFRILSLFVFADNVNALSVYRQCGFEVVQKVEVPPNELIPHEGGRLLMKCGLSRWSGATAAGAVARE